MAFEHLTIPFDKYDQNYLDACANDGWVFLSVVQAGKHERAMLRREYDANRSLTERGLNNRLRNEIRGSDGVSARFEEFVRIAAETLERENPPKRYWVLDEGPLVRTQDELRGRGAYEFRIEPNKTAEDIVADAVMRRSIETRDARN
jgi:hypothetical protein